MGLVKAIKNYQVFDNFEYFLLFTKTGRLGQVLAVTGRNEILNLCISKALE